MCPEYGNLPALIYLNAIILKETVLLNVISLPYDNIAADEVLIYS
jgi:hypothetical protein